jgi:hypothetical protein
MVIRYFVDALFSKNKCYILPWGNFNHIWMPLANFKAKLVGGSTTETLDRYNIVGVPSPYYCWVH